jgi:hypothetical protein
MFLQSRIIDSHSLPQGKWFSNYRPTQSGAETSKHGNKTAGTQEETESTAKPTVCRRIFGNSGSQGNIRFQYNKYPPPCRYGPTSWEAIHAASQLRLNDPKFAFSDFTAQLLQFVTPRLPQSVIAVPAFVGSSSNRGDSRDTDGINDKNDMNDAAVGTLSACLEKTFAEWQYVTAMQQQQLKRNRLRMQIRRKYHLRRRLSSANGHFGGSVLVGRNCRKLVGLGLATAHATTSARIQIGRLERFVQEFWTDPGTAATTTPTSGH